MYKFTEIKNNKKKNCMLKIIMNYYYLRWKYSVINERKLYITPKKSDSKQITFFGDTKSLSFLRFNIG